MSGKEYMGILQIEFAFHAKNKEDAQERAETVADILKGNYGLGKHNRWMPAEVEVTEISVQGE